jgi:glycosyltransferase involved in cell wall biosynthesis
MVKIKIGYLHIYAESFSYVSGVTRYGKKLSAVAEQAFGDEVIVGNYDLLITGNTDKDLQVINAIAKSLNQYDIVQMQFCRHLWGKQTEQKRYIEEIFANIQKPIVVTLHDIYEYCYPKGGFWKLLSQENIKKRKQSKLKSLAIRSTVRQVKEYLEDREIIEHILERAVRCITCNHEEKRRISHLKNSDKISIIPHYIESVENKIEPQAARELLGNDFKKKIITLQGFIHPAKGHQIAVEALAYLPDDINLIFAGAVTQGSEDFYKRLMSLAKRLKVKDRILTTGYLSDQDMEMFLSATDLAICPFTTLSASGSLSTWLAVEKPILASDLPQIEEYNQMSGGAIFTFKPYESSALATAIQSYLNQAHDPQKIRKLKENLSLEASFRKYFNVYNSFAKAT